MTCRHSSLLASIGLAVGGLLGLAGSFLPSPDLRGLAWGIDGVALVMASALLTIQFARRGRDLVASGFLVFALGQGLVVSTASADFALGRAAFGAGCGLWAAGLALISGPPVLPAVVRVLGIIAALLLGVTALLIFGGQAVDPLTEPLPFFAYPFLVATMFGWIWALLGDHIR
ncbi:hypothetical protein [Acuticoccus kandeliae]|uniref:hypothetical protein n=1 Tax=Acuticoccus kandeliae TaxID=2073160 RepID=UPI0013009B2D|nr:hypothetical protein [Acuticoccus kandeliae]